MKKAIFILAIFLVVMAESRGQRQASNDDFIRVDVTKSYPEKELILQDFMNVEYIALETNDDFLHQGMVMAIGKEIIVVKNVVNDGDIFIYDRKGKALRKFNRKGQGGQEYINITGIVPDEDNGEMFVNDRHANKIMVYDLYGKFKRKLMYKEGSSIYTGIHNFDGDKLICCDERPDAEKEKIVQSFFIISKQDGSIVKEIEIPFKQEKSSVLMHIDGEMVIFALLPHIFPIIPHKSDWILMSPSSDTVFSYSPDHTRMPFIVRTPSIQSMNPEIFLFPNILTDRYCFMESVKKEYNFKTETGFPAKKLMYDRQEKTVYEYTVYNGDYTNKETISMSMRTINDDIAFCRPIGADVLVEAYKKGELKGKLKEIAATLDEEDNPVIMLVKHKR